MRAGMIAASLQVAACQGRQELRPVRIAHESEIPPSLDPELASVDGSVHSVLSNFYEPLVGFDRDMHIRPALAVGWSTPEDSTWVLELRRRVHFHDGAVLTAADAQQGLERARSDPDSTGARHLGTIDRIEVMDAQHLRIRTRGPDPLLMNRLTAVLIGRQSLSADGSVRFVGTGPYQFTGWQKGSLRARAFGGYWRGAPSIPDITFVLSAGEAGVTLFERGELDVLRLGENLERIRRVKGARVISRSSIAGIYLWYDSRPSTNGRANPFSDHRVREAVSVAIDRKALAHTRGENTTPLAQLVPDGVFGHLVDLQELSHDPLEARRLLRQAHYPNGLDAGVLSYSPGASVTTEVAQSVQSALEDVGIRVSLATPEWRTLLALWSAGQLPLFLATWFFESGDATSFFVDCVETRDAHRRAGVYNPGFSSAPFDALIEEQAGIRVEADRLKHFRKLVTEGLAELPVDPLISPGVSYALSARVSFDPRLDGQLLAFEMSLREP
jgi:peptide/nickel transport system substrate-binding protein